MPTIGGLPGTEELTSWLESLDEKTRQEVLKRSNPGGMGRAASPVSAQVIPPQGPRMMTGAAGMPVKGSAGPLSVGNFAQSAGKIARGAGRVAGPAGAMYSAYSMFEPLATAAGGALGDVLAAKMVGNPYAVPHKLNVSALDALQGEQQQGNNRTLSSLVTGSVSKNQAPQQQQEEPPNPYSTFEDMPEELRLDMSPTVDMEAMNTPAVEDQEEQVPEGMNTPATEGVDLETLVELMYGLPKYAAPQETVDSAAVETINKASKNVAERPQKKGGFVEGLKRTLTAGAGPWDFSRYDRQQEDLYQAKNALTDREKVGVNAADKAVSGAQQFNRQGQMAEYENGGMSPQQRFMIDLLAGERKIGQVSKSRAAQAEQEHNYRLAELNAADKNQRYSPEVINQMTLSKLAQEYPDLFPSVTEDIAGATMDPKAVDSIRRGRIKGIDPEQMLEALRRIREQGIVAPKK